MVYSLFTAFIEYDDQVKKLNYLQCCIRVMLFQIAEKNLALGNMVFKKCILNYLVKANGTPSIPHYWDYHAVYLWNDQNNQILNNNSSGTQTCIWHKNCSSHILINNCNICRFANWINKLQLMCGGSNQSNHNSPSRLCHSFVCRNGHTSVKNILNQRKMSPFSFIFIYKILGGGWNRCS